MANRRLVYGVTASATVPGSFLGPLTGGSVASVFGIGMVFVVTAPMMAASWLWVFSAVPRADFR